MDANNNRIGRNMTIHDSLNAYDVISENILNGNYARLENVWLNYWKERFLGP